MSLSAAVHGKSLYLFDHLLDNNQDEKGEGYRPILKIWDSTLTIPGYDILLFTLTATPSQASWYTFQVPTQLLEDLGNSNLIVIQSLVHYSWTDIILSYKYNDRWGEYCSPSPMRAREEDLRLWEMGEERNN